MAKKTPPKDDTNDETEGGLSPEAQLGSFLKANKEDHFNFEEDNPYRVRASSLSLTAVMEGGVGPGAHRAVGVTTGGKTSCTLDLMYHFLQRGKGHRGLYVKAEGRLSDEVKARSGITFVTNWEEWKDGTCFIFESNVYEAIFSLLGGLIKTNPTKTKYFTILDSLDMMAKKEDLAKPYEKSSQVAGGAVLTSVFLKKTSAALAKRGHICWFISQVRDTIKVDEYAPTPFRQGNASGGHAIEHAGDWVLEFLRRWPSKDLIREGDEKTGKILGHYCKVRIVKSNNEKYDVEIRYPIKYGQKNASSVWVEREIGDMMVQWEQVEKNGSWLKLAESLRTEVATETGVQLPEKVQGMEKLYALLEAEPRVTQYLFAYYLHLATGQ